MFKKIVATMLVFAVLFSTAVSALAVQPRAAMCPEGDGGEMVYERETEWRDMYHESVIEGDKLYYVYWFYKEKIYVCTENSDHVDRVTVYKTEKKIC